MRRNPGVGSLLSIVLLVSAVHVGWSALGLYSMECYLAVETADEVPAEASIIDSEAIDNPVIRDGLEGAHTEAAGADDGYFVSTKRHVQNAATDELRSYPSSPDKYTWYVRYEGRTMAVSSICLL